MGRRAKQLVYGLFYLLILGAVVGLVYYSNFRPVPTCFDNKKNQNEERIDCGGSCLPCELKNLNLETEGAKALVAGEEKTTLLTLVKNPSQNYSARFNYQFEVLGHFGEVLMSPSGKSSLLARESKYIVLPALPIAPEGVVKVNFKINNLGWEKSSPPLYQVKLDYETNIQNGRVVISGNFANNSPFSISNLRFTAILFDNEGSILNASITQLSLVQAFSQKQFKIFFPEVKGLGDKVNKNKTQIFWEIKI